MTLTISKRKELPSLTSLLKLCLDIEPIETRLITAVDLIAAFGDKSRLASLQKQLKAIKNPEQAQALLHGAWKLQGLDGGLAAHCLEQYLELVEYAPQEFMQAYLELTLPGLALSHETTVLAVLTRLKVMQPDLMLTLTAECLKALASDPLKACQADAPYRTLLTDGLQAAGFKAREKALRHLAPYLGGLQEEINSFLQEVRETQAEEKTRFYLIAAMALAMSRNTAYLEVTAECLHEAGNLLNKMTEGGTRDGYEIGRYQMLFQTTINLLPHLVQQEAALMEERIKTAALTDKARAEALTDLAAAIQDTAPLKAVELLSKALSFYNHLEEEAQQSGFFTRYFASAGLLETRIEAKLKVLEKLSLISPSTAYELGKEAMLDLDKMEDPIKQTKFFVRFSQVLAGDQRSFAIFTIALKESLLIEDLADRFQAQAIVACHLARLSVSSQVGSDTAKQSRELALALVCDWSLVLERLLPPSESAAKLTTAALYLSLAEDILKGKTNQSKLRRKALALAARRYQENPAWQLELEELVGIAAGYSELAAKLSGLCQGQARTRLLRTCAREIASSRD
ncbi:MAG: hypothetical protein HY986_22660 [Candidatus Melainabacteria bacterium]|nr:hypothetical protein [Candidatus Melainabacteria bacterium]